MTAQPITEAQARAARELLKHTLIEGADLDALQDAFDAFNAWREAAIPHLEDMRRIHEAQLEGAHPNIIPAITEMLAELDALLPEPPSP